MLAAPMAAPAKSPATTKNKERKQNKKISAAATRAKQAATAIPVLAAQLGTVNASAVQIVTDLGSPKQLANNVNFLIAAAGALANDVNALESVDTKHDTQIAQLQKQTSWPRSWPSAGRTRTAASASRRRCRPAATRRSSASPA